MADGGKPIEHAGDAAKLDHGAGHDSHLLTLIRVNVRIKVGVASPPVNSSYRPRGSRITF
jgi:hypothetical protein